MQMIWLCCSCVWFVIVISNVVIVIDVVVGVTISLSQTPRNSSERKGTDE